MTLPQCIQQRLHRHVARSVVFQAQGGAEDPLLSVVVEAKLELEVAKRYGAAEVKALSAHTVAILVTCEVAIVQLPVIDAQVLQQRHGAVSAVLVSDGGQMCNLQPVHTRLELPAVLVLYWIWPLSQAAAS